MHKGLLRSLLPWSLFLALASAGTYVTLGPVGSPSEGSASPQGAAAGATVGVGAASHLLASAGGVCGAGGSATREAPGGPRLEGGQGARGARGAQTGVTVRFPPCTLAKLRKLSGWTPFLRGWHGLPAAQTPEARAQRLAALLAQVEDPVVRQNVIFAVTLMVPWAEARPWLEGLRVGADPDDAEDALVALAFSGDPAARGAFLALARTPSPAQVKRLVDSFAEHDQIAAEGTREARTALRAWRAIEALDRDPYFKLVPYYVTHDWSGEGSRELLAWLPRQPLGDADHEGLLKAWLTRYPGHPGSDGIALRVARLRVEADDATGAASWFARALAGPDQDRAHRAEAPMVALTERVLSRSDLRWLADAEGLDTPSRTLFRYAYLRRTAAEVGFEEGCREAEGFARSEPGQVLGWAWLARGSAKPPRGLLSGLNPLSPSDELLQVVTQVPPAPEPVRMRLGEWSWGEEGATLVSEREEEARPGLRPWLGMAGNRLEPRRDPVVLDRARLVGQMRAWEALAALERRAARVTGAQRADLLYKQAAVLYHDRDVLFPCYARHTMDFGGDLRSLDEPGGLPATDDLLAYSRRSFAWERAIGLFERIEREHPEYPAMDKVLFSQAMCWKRLVDYRPRGVWMGWDWDGAERDHPAAEAARACVALFERLVREYPSSPLADDAARAAAWWRAQRPKAFAASSTTLR